MLAKNSRRTSPLWFAPLALALLVGCGDPKTYPVQEDIGRAAMKTFLDSWQAGEPFDGLANKSPKIVGADQDWKSGIKLLSYEIVESRAYERSMMFGVKLNIQRLATVKNAPPAGAADDPEAVAPPPVASLGTQMVDEEKHANYTVATQPYITVFRDEAD